MYQYVMHHWTSHWWWLGRKAPPGWGNFFLHWIYPCQAISSNFGFCGSISGNFEQLWFLWQKSPPPPRWGKNFWHLSISGWFSATLVFVAEKPPPRIREDLDLSISNFKQLWFLAEKFPPPFRSIHFRQFRATLVFVAEKPPPQDEGKFFYTDLSISGNFKQLWFLWQKSPPPPQAISRWRENFWLQIYPFQAILSNFGFVAEKPPPSPRMREKFLYFRSIHFRQFWATLVLVAEKPPGPPGLGKIFLTSDLSISGNFEQLWFLWQKSSPLSPRMRENFLHWIYPFQAISSNFGFCGRKAPPPR